ncbi:MAG: hypothetical protein WCL18_00690 [bacterium]
MNNYLITACKRIFAIGFIIAGVAFAYQAFTIITLGKAQGVSLLTFIVFTFLHSNGIVYSYYIAKDKILLTGTILNAMACLTIVILKIYYG